jgi:hypothetical protein
MKGYDTLFKLNIPSKTLETSFLLLNRQIWTNVKESQVTREEEGGEGEAGGGGGDIRQGKCPLCQGTENTMHLMFECPVYSEPIWGELETAINFMLLNERPDAPRVSLHAYQVLCSAKGCSKQFEGQIATDIPNGSKICCRYVGFKALLQSWE